MDAFVTWAETAKQKLENFEKEKEVNKEVLKKGAVSTDTE